MSPPAPNRSPNDQRAALLREPCTCVSCGDCRGTGTWEVPSLGYPEYELESCDTCGGSGILDVCERCQMLDELEHDEL